LELVVSHIYHQNVAECTLADAFRVEHEQRKLQLRFKL